MISFLDRCLVRMFNVHPIKSTQVFTPTTAAELNYVRRPKLESLITNSLLTPGKQLLLFGHSGSGKTTLIRNVLKFNRIGYIKTHCEAASSFNDIVYAAFDSLNVFVEDEVNKQLKRTITGKLASEYRVISSTIQSEYSEESDTKMVRLLPPQLTPQKLAQFFGEGDLVWIIEDFHKVADNEKKRIADLLKIFVDNANDYQVSKVVCIGACENATDLVKLEPDLKTRVDEIKVHMLSDVEIRNLVTNGCELLNLKIEERLLDLISYYSSHIASTAHQMCLDICTSKNVLNRKWKSVQLCETDFEAAIKGYVEANEGTFSNAYEVAVRDELGWYILRTFSKNSHKKLSVDEIQRIVNKSKRFYTEDQIKAKLEELCSMGLGVLFYSSSADKYMLSSPYWESFLRIQFELESAEQKSAKKKPKLDFVSIENKNDYIDRIMYDLILKIKNGSITVTPQNP